MVSLRQVSALKPCRSFYSPPHMTPYVTTISSQPPKLKRIICVTPFVVGLNEKSIITYVISRTYFLLHEDSFKRENVTFGLEYQQKILLRL